MPLKIKICGLKQPENIRDVMALGPDYIGFIFFSGSKRYINGLDAEWVRALKGVKKTGVFVDADPAEVEAAIARYGLEAVQLHGSESPEYCAGLMGGSVEVIKAFGINNHFNWDKLATYENVADYFLFDTQSTQHGGTGIPFDWSLLGQNPSDKLFFLSGGISAGNIQTALGLRDKRLYALDLNSKFEIEPGLKDITLLKNTLQIINDE